MKAMNKILAVVLMLTACAFGQQISQLPPAAGQFVASQYFYGGPGQGNPPALKVSPGGGTNASGSGTLILSFGAVSLANGRTIMPLATNAPITVDSGANLETVTPSAVSCSTPTINLTCSVTATFSFAHGAGAPITSGSFGLQEAINDAQSGGGGLVILDTLWSKLGGTAAAITSATVYQSVSIEDHRQLGAMQYYNAVPATATILATPTTLVAGTAASNLGVASGVAGTWTAGTVHACIAYVDVMGNEGPCSADFSFTAVVSQAIGFTAPAASTGAVGYVPYISLVSGTYALSYRVPISSSVCTLTTVETTIAACAVANTTYGQVGSGALVTAPPANTQRIWVGIGGTSTTADYVGNSNAKTSYLYAPSMHIGLPGVIATSMPFTTATATATTVPGVIGTIQLPAGFMNYVGRAIRVCGLAKEASAGSTSTITTIQFLWDADGSNTTGAGVILGGPTVTATLVTANADQWSFCQDIKTTVSGAGVTAGSLILGTGWLMESYGAATTVSAAAGPTIGAAAVASLNLAGEGRIDVVYLHTTGTDGAGVTLQDLTVEVIN